jgi:hypothetical protein
VSEPEGHPPEPVPADPPATGSTDPEPESGSAAAPRRDAAWVRALEEPVERFFAAFRVPIAVALFVAAGTLWGYSALVAHGDIQLGRLVDARTKQLRSEALLQLQIRANALDEVARMWEGRTNANLDTWSQDAEMLLRRNMQYRAVAWLAPDLSTVATEPSVARLPGWPLGPEGDDARLRTMSALAAESNTEFSRSYVFGDGSRQILVRAPMYHINAPISYLIGVMRPRDLIDALVDPAIRDGYAVSVYEGPYLLFGPDWSNETVGTQWTREVEVVNGELGLRMRIWPSEDLLRQVHSRAPRMVLIAGLVLALLMAVLVRRIQVLSDRLHRDAA